MTNASTETKPKAVIAPEGCDAHLTAGKRYEIERWLGDGLFVIRADRGQTCHCLLEGCAHLGGGDWMIADAADPEFSTPEAQQARKRKAEADSIREIESRLWSAFEWMQTPQGHFYWAEVARNLDAIADKIEAGQ